MTAIPDPADYADAVDDTMSRWLGSTAVERAERRGRDRAIRDALDVGFTVPQIAARTGLSRERIYQIRDGRR